ncbi:MAG: hypothetical protein K0B08_09755 [Bacteroidales bacterium]|nr:hypothetical protein [Bacteroidales bacterium]
MLIKIIVLSLYALLIVVIGIIGLKKTRSFSDFFLGGGKVGAWMTAFSYGTAYFSAVVFIGFAGKVGWGFGYSGIWIGVFNALVGVLAVWALLGWKVKKMSVEMGVTTLSEFLEKRYQSPALKLIASIAIFVFLVPYSAAVFIHACFPRSAVRACCFLRRWQTQRGRADARTPHQGCPGIALHHHPVTDPVCLHVNPGSPRAHIKLIFYKRLLCRVYQ